MEDPSYWLREENARLRDELALANLRLENTRRECHESQLRVIALREQMALITFTCANLLNLGESRATIVLETDSLPAILRKQAE